MNGMDIIYKAADDVERALAALKVLTLTPPKLAYAFNNLWTHGCRFENNEFRLGVKEY